MLLEYLDLRLLLLFGVVLGVKNVMVRIIFTAFFVLFFNWFLFI